MRHRDLIVLDKIVSEINIAENIISGVGYEDFEKNEVVKRAVCMTVINIGELVKNLSAEFREENKAVPWKAIAGFRDVAAHKYQTLYMRDVYKTVTEDLPELKCEIQSIKEI